MVRPICSLLIFTALLAISASPTSAQPNQQYWQSRSRALAGGGQKLNLAGLDVVVWEPASFKLQRPAAAPLVIFSHGFRGYNAQSIFLMKAMAEAGYLVIAPNHKDAIKYGISRAQVRFFNIDGWTEQTYRDRQEDIKNLIDALHQDETWNSKIDWTKLALAGHSLGGYTVLGLAGAWASWKLPGVKAIVALAPYTNPYIKRETLKNIDVPVMYQIATRDVWIDPFVKGRNGAFSLTAPPAIYVEFNHANHFAWTNFNRNLQQENLISHYCIEFLNKYVLNSSSARPEEKLAGVAALRVK